MDIGGSLPNTLPITSAESNDIANLPEPAQTIRDENLVVSWWTNHHKPLVILREKVKQTIGKSCEMKKAGATRMGTNT